MDTQPYPPKHARENRQELLIDAIGQIQFGAVIADCAGTIEAVHIPLMVRHDGEQLLLEGHVSRTNPLALKNDIGQALIIFQGPHGYVHPGWLETKRLTGKAVPTWNYVVIHARGKIAMERDPDWLLQHVERLTDKNEAQRSDPWSVSDSPDGFIDKMLAGIVGLKMHVEQLSGIWKLMGNHPEANRSGVIEGLMESASRLDHDLADAMRSNRMPHPS